MSYVSVEEFAGYLRTPFDEEDAYTAQLLLDDADGIVNNYLEVPAGTTLLQSTDTVSLDGTGTAELVLPRWPVTAVVSVSVTEDGDDTPTALVVVDDYTWSASGVLTRVGACWPCGARSVVVVNTAGYAAISADIKRICRRLAAAAWHNPAGADMEDTADHRVRWNTPAAELTTGERHQLDVYRLGR